MSLPNEVNLQHLGSTGYNITKSLRFRESASSTLTRTPGSAGNRKKTTFSAWIKRGKLGGSGGIVEATAAGKGTFITWGSDNVTIQMYDPTYNTVWNTLAVYRDPAAWYHVVVIIDTTQATQAGMVTVYVNGVQQTLGINTHAATVPQNYDTYLNNTVKHNINTYVDGVYGYADQYMAEVNYIDGQTLSASYFGEFDSITGVWKPKAYTGTYGTNGFYLPFTNTTSTATLGNDSSGNGNTWTVNNISLTAGATYDSMTDVPTLTSATVANYCVINPLEVYAVALTVSNGNLTGASTGLNTLGTIWATSGKFYAEAVLTTAGSDNLGVGVQAFETYPTNGDVPLRVTGAVGYFHQTGTKFVDNVSSAYGASYTINDVIGIAVDISGGTITFYKNNTSQGAISYSFTGKTWTFAAGRGGTVRADVINWNFGQRPFSYTPPTGFKALNTYNLPDSTIVAGNKYMDATLYTGDGTTGRTITNAGSFKPDFVWIKSRSNALNNNWYDSNRGAPLEISSNLGTGEFSGDLTAFASNGFTINQTVSFEINHSAYTYVAWQWKAAGSNTTNTSGTITSQVNANPLAGFSVVTFNNPTSGTYTVGHGLGIAPQLVIIKYRSTSNWFVYHGSLGYTEKVFLNTTAASGAAAYWTANPTSTVVNFDTAFTDNPSQSLVMYCWASIAGFSAFGSYTGNASTDGPFVYTGFRPKYVIIKRTSNTQNWQMQDTARNPYNSADNYLMANSSAAEAADVVPSLDILSNGFKIKTSNVTWNANGDNYIYCCWAENPFKYSLAR